MQERSRVVAQNVRQCGATLGENNCLAKKREFIGAPFGHGTGTVSPSQKAIRKLRDAPPLERPAVAESERLASHMVYAAGVCGGALFEYYFFVKAVRRRLSKLNWGLLRPNGAAVLPAQEDRQGKRWLSPLLGNRPVAPQRHRPTSAAFGADASMYGWGALLFKDTGEVCVAGGARDREPRRVSQGKASAVSLVPSSFAEMMPKNLHIGIGNAAAMNVMKKGNANCDALVRDPSLIDKVLQEQGVQTSWDYIASARNPANRISCVNGFRNDVAKGWRMRRETRRTR
ncbi:hypothetical protein ERJ75_001754700 [Trypanosoma vivax]|nr:hypothetical protein ERJ75_001754700 [Trypanosoma vivax]